MILAPSTGSVGISRARAPVATMIAFASSVVASPTVSPSIVSEGSTDTFPPPISVALPKWTSTLFFFMRNCTPLFILSATPRERLTTAAKSGWGSDAPSPPGMVKP